MEDRASAQGDGVAYSIRRAGDHEAAEAHGHFDLTCHAPDGQLKWTDRIENIVCTEGKNLMLDTTFAGSAYTKTGPFMGLISSASFSTTAAADTAAQINGSNGWKEAGGANAPTYSGSRPTCVWAGATGGVKALSANLTFNLTGSGTVKGCFILLGNGATSTIDNANGTLWSAGLFSNGDKTVGSGDSISANYSTSL